VCSLRSAVRNPGPLRPWVRACLRWRPLPSNMALRTGESGSSSAGNDRKPHDLLRTVAPYRYRGPHAPTDPETRENARPNPSREHFRQLQRSYPVSARVQARNVESKSGGDLQGVRTGRPREPREPCGANRAEEGQASRSLLDLPQQAMCRRDRPLHARHVLRCRVEGDAGGSGSVTDLSGAPYARTVL
jgi:hypothetical protein